MRPLLTPPVNRPGGTLRRIFTVVCILLFIAASTAHSQEEEEIKELKASVKAMQKIIAEQNARIAALEKQQQQKPAPSPSMQPSSPAASTAMQGQAQPVKYNLAGVPQAAPRVNLTTSGSSPAGFLAIPGTEAMFKIGGSVRVDVIADQRNNGNPNEFITSTIPVPGQPGADNGSRSTVHTKGSRLSLEVRQPLPDDNTLRIYSEFDFFNDSASSAMSIRARHFYAEAYHFLVGQSFSAFMDPDVYPDVIDYEGPNALMYKRQPQIRYTFPAWQEETERVLLFASIEQPNSEIGTGTISTVSGASAVNHIPDGVIGSRWEGRLGHVQGAALFRELGFDDVNGGRMNTLGWGATLSGALNVSKHDTFMGQVTYGEGIAHYVNDLGGENLDAAFNGAGIDAIPVFAITGAYTHLWNDHWSSTVSGGYLHVDSPWTFGPFAIDNTVYASVNLLWRPTPSMRMGLEYLYGSKGTINGSDRDAQRLDFVIRYDLGH